jgi:3-hydroxyacyl-CoA dehydrogenase/enoyl-CoA hydratase/carnithine racemase
MTAPSTAGLDPTQIFPDELVTEAHLRFIQIPGVSGDVALITLDNGEDHTKPSSFGPAGLLSLSKALDEVESRTGLAAVAVTGKQFVFAIGADITGVSLITERSQAMAIGQLGHSVFRRLHDSRVPTFALINGAAMGGGVEVGLNCHYRTLASDVGLIAMPECFLGLVPGWGGTQLLPPLVGPDNAVTLIIENALSQNRTINAAKAFKLGLADVVFEPADFLEQSLLWVAKVLRGEVTPERRPTPTSEEYAAALERGKAIADGKVNGAAPAPYRALELIAMAEQGNLTAGFAAEDAALTDLIMSEELRSGLYSFDLVQRRAKRPAGAPDRSLARPITKVGVVGAGLMASQLALLFARRLEVPVVLTDIDQARVDKGVGYVHADIDGQLAKGRISPDRARRLKASVTGSLTKDVFADADVVIEAVFEDLAVKQQVFAEVEAVVSDTCLILTNTSSLSVSAMASKLAHPERVVGFHFFNPVAVLPLVEIVRAAKTDDASLATAFGLAKAIGKSAVGVSDQPAFVVNRLLTRFLGEVTAAVDEGTPFEVADSALAPLGLPMSPFVLLALVGPGIALHVSETLHGAFPDRFGVSENLRRMVEAGKTDIYLPGTLDVDPEVAEAFAGGTSPSTAEQVRDRALNALAEEIRLMLDEGVVAEAQDIDLCMLLGAGWPFHLGGIIPYLDRAGISQRAAGGRFLAKGVASLS